MTFSLTFPRTLTAREPEWDGVNAIELRQVIKTFETPAGHFTALKGVTLQVRAGEFASVVGKSGSGKSTLINMVTGIDRPTSGELFVAGIPIHKLTEGQIAVWRGKSIGVVFQFFQLLPTLTAVENILLAMDYGKRYPASERCERAMHLLEQVGLPGLAHWLPAELSGGQQQMVAVARALANDPLLIAADEPTGNLDSRSAEVVFMLFETLAQAGKTILMVTHDQALARCTWRSIVLADGKVVDQIEYRTRVEA